MTLGWHIIAEFEQCSRSSIDDIEYVEKHLNESAKIAGATIVKSVFHKFAPQGISGVVVIEESHFGAWGSIDTFKKIGQVSDFSDSVLPRGFSGHAEFSPKLYSVLNCLKT